MSKKNKKKKLEIPEIHIEEILTKLSRCKNLSNKGIKWHINRLHKVEKNSLKNQWEDYLNDLLKKVLDELNESKDSNSVDLIYKNSNKDFKNLEVALDTLYENKKFYSAQLNNAKNKLREKLEERRKEIKVEYIKECTEKVNKLTEEIGNIQGVDDTKSVEEIDMIIAEYSGIKRIEKKDYRDNEGKVKESEFRKLKKLSQKAKNIAEDIEKYDKEIYREVINKINESIRGPNFYSHIYELDFKKEKLMIYKSLENEISVMGHNAILKIGSYNPENNQININEDDIKKALNKISPSLSYLTKRIYDKIKDENFRKENLSS